MPLDLTFLRRVSLLTRISQCVYLARGFTGWISLWIALVEPLKLFDRRVTKITSTIDRIIDLDFFLSARRLASFTGQIISTAPVSGNISWTMTRHCTMSTFSVQPRDSKVNMDPCCIEELYFWKNNINSIKLCDCLLFNKPRCFTYSDASATGCGSVITLNENCVCHKLWEPSERFKSSTWRELAVVDFSQESFALILVH